MNTLARKAIIILTTLLPLPALSYLKEGIVENKDAENEGLFLTKDISGLIIADINPTLKREIGLDEAFENLRNNYPELNDSQLEGRLNKIVDKLIENGIVLETDKIIMASDNLSRVID